MPGAFLQRKRENKKLTSGHFLEATLSAESVFLGSSDIMHVQKKIKEEKYRKKSSIFSLNIFFEMEEKKIEN